jgi:hypothetical protein
MTVFFGHRSEGLPVVIETACEPPFGKAVFGHDGNLFSGKPETEVQVTAAEHIVAVNEGVELPEMDVLQELVESFDAFVTAFEVCTEEVCTFKKRSKSSLRKHRDCNVRRHSDILQHSCKHGYIA